MLRPIVMTPAPVTALLTEEENVLIFLVHTVLALEQRAPTIPDSRLILGFHCVIQSWAAAESESWVYSLTSWLTLWGLMGWKLHMDKETLFLPHCEPSKTRTHCTTWLMARRICSHSCNFLFSSCRHGGDGGSVNLSYLNLPLFGFFWVFRSLLIFGVGWIKTMWLKSLWKLTRTVLKMQTTPLRGPRMRLRRRSNQIMQGGKKWESGQKKKIPRLIRALKEGGRDEEDVWPGPIQRNSFPLFRFCCSSFSRKLQKKTLQDRNLQCYALWTSCCCHWPTTPAAGGQDDLWAVPTHKLCAMHTHTHTHTTICSMHTHTHTQVSVQCTHTHTHKYLFNAHTHKYLFNAHTHTHTHTSICSMHTHTHKYLFNARTQALMHTQALCNAHTHTTICSMHTHQLCTIHTLTHKLCATHTHPQALHNAHTHNHLFNAHTQALHNTHTHTQALCNTHTSSAQCTHTSSAQCTHTQALHNAHTHTSMCSMHTHTQVCVECTHTQVSVQCTHTSSAQCTHTWPLHNIHAHIHTHTHRQAWRNTVYERYDCSTQTDTLSFVQYAHADASQTCSINSGTCM